MNTTKENETNMNNNEENLDADALLDILANNTRRKILQLLAAEELYPFQISRILDISPRIIGKYINELEALGLVSTVERASSKGPARKYAKLNKSFSLIIDIGSNNFQWKVIKVGEPVDSERDLTEQQPEITDKIREEIYYLKNQITEKAKKIRSIEEKRKGLIEEINECFSYINEIIDNTILNYQDRTIVRTLLKEIIRSEQQEWITLSQLAETLRMWRGDLKERLLAIAETTKFIKMKKHKSGELLFSI